VKPQCVDLLAELRARGDEGLTDLQALDALGIRRLAARVADLRAEGFDVRTQLVATAAGKRIGIYRLVERPRPTTGTQEALAL
jgi:hypothetical protein